MSVANARVFRHLMKASRSVVDNCDIGNTDGFMRFVSNRFRVVAEANRRARIRPSELKKHRAMVVHYSNAMREAIGDEELTSILNALAAGVGSSVYKRTLEKGFFDLVLFRKRSEERGEADENETAERQNRIMQAAIAPIAERLSNLHRGYTVPQLRDAMSSTKVGTSALVLSQGSAEIVVEIDDDLNKQTIYVRAEDDPFMHVMLKQGAMQQASSSSSTDSSSTTKFPKSVSARHFSEPADAEGEGEKEGAATGGPSTANLNGVDPNEDPDEAHYADFRLFNERVDVMESDLIRGTTLHAQWGGLAHRLLDAVLEEMPLHRSRSTVLAGHGVGGAVALAMGFQLHTMGFDVKNIFQFGSPRIIQDTLNRFVTAVNPIRIVINGDPCTQGPASTSEGESFVHVGEVLMLGGEGGSSPLDDEENEDNEDGGEEDASSSYFFGEDEGNAQMKGSSSSFSSSPSASHAATANKRLRNFAKRYDVHRYAALLKRDDIPLMYAEGDDSILEPEWKFVTNADRGGNASKKPLHGAAPETFDR